MTPPEADQPPEPPAQEALAPAGPVTHLVAGLVPVALGVAGLGYALTLGVGTPVSAGPGLWPAVASALLCGAGLWSLVLERRSRDCERLTRGTRDIVIGVASLLLYVPLLRRVGFELPTLLLLAFWLKVLGRESWRLAITASVSTTAAFYLVFIVLLGVPLPRLTFG